VVVCSFREDDIAWASDIEAMFIRFQLASEDANHFCLVQSRLFAAVFRMDRLPFGVSCSPFVAIHTLKGIAEDSGSGLVNRAKCTSTIISVHNRPSLRAMS